MPEIEEQQRGNGCFDLKNERIYDDYDVLPFDCYEILIYINVFFFKPETKINQFDFSKNQKEPFYYWPAAFVSLCFCGKRLFFFCYFHLFVYFLSYAKMQSCTQPKVNEHKRIGIYVCSFFVLFVCVFVFLFF